MDLWSEIEELIKQHGVRVDERMELLALLKADHGTNGSSVAERKEALDRRFEDAAARVKEALRA